MLKKCDVFFEPESFDEGHSFDVSDGPAELDDADLRLGLVRAHGDRRDAFHPVLDGVGDVGYNLFDRKNHNRSESESIW